MKNKVILLAVGVSFIITLKSCEYHELTDVTTSVNTIQSVFNEINDQGYQYYQNGSILSAASASPHGSFRLRFNDAAWSSLNGDGELPVGGQFKDGSFIVKEVYHNNVLSLYAIMKKASSDPKAGNGWLWSEYLLDGTPLVNIEGKGNGCISCHDDTPNRDLVRTFDFH